MRTSEDDLITRVLNIAKESNFIVTTARVQPVVSTSTKVFVKKKDNSIPTGILAIVAYSKDKETTVTNFTRLKERLSKELNLTYVGYASDTTCVMHFNIYNGK